MKMLERHYVELTKDIPPGTDMPAIDVTGAAKWFMEDSEKDYWDLSNDFPVVTPPFDFTWMEYEIPRYVNIEGDKREIPRVAMGAKMGCIAMCLEVKEGKGQEIILYDGLRHMVEDIANKSGVPIKRLPGQLEERQLLIGDALRKGYEAKWIVNFRLFLESPKHDLIQFCDFFAYLNPMGQIIPRLHFITSRNPQMQQKLLQAGCTSEIFPFLFALSLMHAKNVTLENIEVPPALAKKRTKQGKKVLQFKTLHIQPMRQKSVQSATENESSTKRAMHLCRGHFKDFRNGPGLFGKLKGLYWWDMQVRGDEANGRIIKDYAINKPV